MKSLFSYEMLPLILLFTLARASIFDTFMSYRHGSSDINIDVSTFPYETEIPRAPESIDDAHVYT